MSCQEWQCLCKQKKKKNLLQRWTRLLLQQEEKESKQAIQKRETETVREREREVRTWRGKGTQSKKSTGSRYSQFMQVAMLRTHDRQESITIDDESARRLVRHVGLSLSLFFFFFFFFFFLGLCASERTEEQTSPNCNRSGR
jgi:Fe2+ transport system protein B